MANYRRRRSRRRFNLRKVRIASFVNAGALASLDVIVGPITNNLSDDMRFMSVDLTYSLDDIGATQDDGQEFGLAHSDYTAAEIEEALEASQSIDLGNKVASEQANRLVRVIGNFQGAPGTGAGKSFNNGLPVKTKLNWKMSSGDQLSLWIRNGSGTVYTTGARVSILGNLWVKDGV